MSGFDQPGRFRLYARRGASRRLAPSRAGREEREAGASISRLPALSLSCCEPQRMIAADSTYWGRVVVMSFAVFSH